MILFVLLFVLVQGAAAEPNQSVKFLMNQPVSLLDFGIYRLEKDLKKIKKELALYHALPFDIAVNYDWENNKILIRLTYGYERNPPRKTIQKGVRHVIKQIRGFLGVDPKGKVFHKRGFSKAADYFSHQGYIIQNRPEALEKDIDEMIVLNVVYSVQNFSRIFECRQALTDSRAGKVSCKEAK